MSRVERCIDNRTYSAISRESGRLSGSSSDSDGKAGIYDVEGVKPVTGSRLIGVILDKVS